MSHLTECHRFLQFDADTVSSGFCFWSYDSLKYLLYKSEATKSKKRVEKLEEWLLYQNIDNHKPSFLFLLISIQSVYFFFNRNTIIIAFRDVYRRTICITETIFVFMSLIRIIGHCRVTPSDFGDYTQNTSLWRIRAFKFGADHQILESHCNLESRKCYLSQPIHQCSCFRTSSVRSPLISHIFGRFKLSTIKYFDVLLQLEWTHYFGSEHIKVHFIDLFECYKKSLDSKTNQIN